MKKFITITIIIVSSIFFSGCSKWLDVNQDPNVATDIKINLILPGALYDIATDLSLGSSNIGFVSSVYVHQITTREEYDQYGINSTSFANSTYWNDLYAGPLTEINTIIRKGEEDDNLIYAGVAKVLKAYVFSQLVDIWGDVPFSEANQEGNFSPKFDNDKEIYKQLFILIDNGIADIENVNSENIFKPGEDDLIYGGDTDKWIRFAKSLKLKLYTQVQKTDLWDATKVQNLLADELIESGGDFMFPFGTQSTPDNRHNGFLEYAGGQIGTYISPWFFEILMGMNSEIHSGNRDPRIPYYWCRQSQVENTPEYADTTGTVNGLKFISIYFGSTGVNRDAGGRATFTMPGIYPVGGKFDDGTPSPATGLQTTDGTGAAPMRLLTYADVLYTKAELYQLGLASGDARVALNEAMEESFKLVDKVVSMNESNQTIPVLNNNANTISYINSVLSEYDAASAEKQLEIIMTQKWIQRFGGSSVDSYTDYRRTGYPVLFDPTIHSSNGGNYMAEPVPTEITRGYVVSWPWPQRELDLNVNAPSQKNQTTDKVFWDVD